MLDFDKMEFKVRHVSEMFEALGMKYGTILKYLCVRNIDDEVNWKIGFGFIFCGNTYVGWV